MLTIFICTILLVLCITALAFFFGPDGGRLWTAWFAFCLTTGLALAGWGIFVAAHFIGKYW